jgi:hypothetical protein
MVASGGESCYHYRVKTLREIFKALTTLRSIPSSTIRDAWLSIEAAIIEDDVDGGKIRLMASIVDAVVAIAKDDEDKPVKPKQGKAATTEG